MTNQPKDPEPSDSQDEQLIDGHDINSYLSWHIPEDYRSELGEFLDKFIRANYLPKTEVEAAIGRNEDDPDRNPRWQAYRNELRQEIRTKLGLHKKGTETI